MPRFRDRLSQSHDRLTESAVEAIIADVIAECHFWSVPELALQWLPVREETVPWEIFRGRLLDPAHCMQERSFRAWNIVADGGVEPMLSVKWDRAARQLFVTRAILSQVWEGYDAGDNVILSREATRWVCELVAVLSLDEYLDAAEARDELAGQLFLAVVGVSRLPLTSVEAPLPAFSLGQLGYFYAEDPSLTLRVSNPSLTLRVSNPSLTLRASDLLERMSAEMSCASWRSCSNCVCAASRPLICARIREALAPSWAFR